MVVTGTAGIAEKRAIGNAVTTVNAAEVVATQPVNSFQELLNGRASRCEHRGEFGPGGHGVAYPRAWGVVALAVE